MKIKNNIVKITTNDGLKKLTRWNNGTYYEPKVEFVIFNINDIMYATSGPRVYVTKGHSKMMLTLTPQAFESLEKIIFKD